MIGAVVASPQASPAAAVRAFDAAYGAERWSQVCHDLTAKAAAQAGKGLKAANPYVRCEDAYIAVVKVRPRDAEAIAQTFATGEIVKTTRTGNAARVTVRYTAIPPVSAAKLGGPQGIPLVLRDGRWLISGG